MNGRRKVGIGLKAATGVMAALIICGGAPAQAQPTDKPPAPSKPATRPKPPAKPAAQPKQATAAEVAGHKSVCVASAIGRTFQVQVIGVMVFGNSYDRVPIESWGMDDAALATIRRVLGKDYNVRRLPVSVAAVSAFENSNDYGGFLRSAAAGAGKCDVYLTLTPIGRPLGNTNQSYGGLGMLDMSRMMFERVFIFASFVLRAYDGNNSMNLLKSVRSGRFEQEFQLGGLASTYRKIDKTWWPTPASSAAQNARLKTVTRELVEEGVTQTLKEIFEGA